MMFIKLTIKKTPLLRLIPLMIGLGFSSISQADTMLPIIKPSVQPPRNTLPEGLIITSRFEYDGDSDDLVTAGIGFSALTRAQKIPTFSNPAQPTAAELRQARLTRYINPSLGEGKFYGFRYEELTPLFDGKFAGSELTAYFDDGSGQQNVAMLLQIPLDFDKRNPCIVAVPASDSNSIYDAKDIQIRGLWGLRHNCAVVYTDKGLGNGLFDIANNRGYLLNGVTATATGSTKSMLQFVPNMTNPIAFNYNNPNRFAIKQLHSQQNPESKWGEYVLKSIEFAFYQINEDFSPYHQPIFNNNNTLVLVYGATDGGGAALKAGELDTHGVIDGIVAVNPQIQPKPLAQLNLQYKNQNTSLTIRPLIDYASYGALYTPCATLAVKNNSPVLVPYAEKLTYMQNSCTTLKEQGLLTANTLEEQAQEALTKLHQYGWESSMDHQLAFQFYTQYTAFPYKYISSLGRYSVEENICNYSIASINQKRLLNNGPIMPLETNDFASFWANATGSIPVINNELITAIDLVNNNDPRGTYRELFSQSNSTKRLDYNVDGALCLRNLATDTQLPRIKNGINEVQANGNLNQIKTFIIHGRDNVAVLPNYSSRPYVALNSYVEGRSSQLRYLEVTNTSYHDAKAPFDSTLLPIDYYGESAMNWLWNHFQKGTSLPDSQVINTVPRGHQPGYAPDVTEKNIVPIMQTPRKNNMIMVTNGTLTIPN